MGNTDRAGTSRARALRRAQTDAEARLWFRLRNRQLAGHKFVRQEPIGPYIVDFVCRELKLVVELDGSQHAESAHDVKRDAWLQDEGYRVIRFWNHEVMQNLESVLETVFARAEEQQTSPRSRGEAESRQRPGERQKGSGGPLLSPLTPHPNPLPVNGEREIAALLAKLAGFRGKLERDAPTASLSWFRTGGAVDVLATPVDEDDLALLLKAVPGDVPILVVGLGSNLLVRDGGYRGVMIRLGKGFGAIRTEGLRVVAGAGAPDVKVARAAAEAGIAGLSFLRGIPGAIGGALRMNGGAYGGEVKDVFVAARALDRQGSAVELSHADMAFGYRRCGAPADLIFTEATFEGQAGDPAEILAQMNAITEARSSTQPVNTRTGGSTFKNPDGHKAWQLVDAAGCRGLTVGGAQVSELHCNFLVNHGEATSADIESLGEEVRRRVKEMSGITLEWEIKRVGEP